MGVIFLGIPIAIFIIFSIFIFVKFSNSNKHLENMDTQSKLELERLRKEVIEKIRNKNNKSDSELLSYEELFQEAKQNQKDIAQLQNIIKNYHAKKYEEINDSQDEIKAGSLVFNKENLVRGIIAKEYLERRKR